MLTLQDLLKTHSKEDIIASAYNTPRKYGIQIRLYNTRPSLASVKALFTKVPAKAENISNSIIDYIPGTSTLTGNRKIDMDTNIALLEDLIASITDPSYIVPLPSSQYPRTLHTKQGTLTIAPDGSIIHSNAMDI